MHISLFFFVVCFCLILNLYYWAESLNHSDATAYASSEPSLKETHLYFVNYAELRYSIYHPCFFLEIQEALKQALNADVNSLESMLSLEEKKYIGKHVFLQNL